MKKILYIKTANLPWEILPKHLRNELFEAYELTTAFFMAKGYPASSDTYENTNFIDLKGDLNALFSLIETTQPNLIYLSTSPHTKSEFLYPILQKNFPKIPFWLEQYDSSDLFTEFFLMENGYTQDEAVKAQKDARLATETAEVIIHKNGGTTWDNYCEKRTLKNNIRWHPIISDISEENSAPSYVKSSKDEINICVCGSVPAQVQHDKTGNLSKDQTLFRVLALLSEIKSVNVYIFNPADRDYSARYESLRNWCANRQKPIHYSCYIPQVKLVQELKRMDLGLFFLPTSTQSSEELVKVGNPNRLSTLIAHNIPVIIDSAITDVAEDIIKTSAGILLSNTEIDQLHHIIANLDLPRLKSGIRTLKRKWQAENARALEEMRKLLTQHT